MTKEDKQIIDRAVKENWRIGDRTRLKHLLEKNLKLYRENAELENENRLLGERCNQLLKDKGDLTDKIADIKANCDLAIEGRDIKIKELEQENNKLLDVINNQDVKIADLEKENAELKERYDKVDIIGYNALKNLTKAKEILKMIVDYYPCYNKTITEQAEQFLKEIEK